MDAPIRISNGNIQKADMELYLDWHKGLFSPGSQIWDQFRIPQRFRGAILPAVGCPMLDDKK
ncbi:hypothetical protein JOC77_002578 [Peribacillus deserti]|uniref:Uncharacterized protein n=1 Tax=Peribacillus deserti TaxID=673318 RepID=A0ABS2QKB2_9BACI|nr:hypothetical protein [Peribacillus deserti]